MVSEKTLRRGFQKSLALLKRARTENKKLASENQVLAEEFKHLPAGLLVFDDEGKLEKISNRTLALFGVEDKKELPLKTVEDFFQDPYESSVGILRSAAERGSSVQTNALIRRKYLSKKPVPKETYKDTFVQFSVVKYANGQTKIHAHISDVEDMFTRIGFASKIFKILPEIYKQKRLQPLMQNLAYHLAQEFDALCLVWKVEKAHDAKGRIKLISQFMPGPVHLGPADLRNISKINLGEGLAGLAAKTGEMQVLEDIKELEQMPIHLAKFDKEHHLGHSIAIPIMWNGKVLGVIGLYKRRDEKFYNYQRALLDLFSQSAAMKITTASLTKKLKFYASHDPITGLYNYGGFFRKMAKSFGVAHNPEETKIADVAKKLKKVNKFRMVVADLNNLKAVNDAFGHLRGDEAIRLFANFLRENLPRESIIGRWGGDEYFAVIPGAEEDPEFSKKLELKFQKLIGEEYAEFKNLNFSVAVGHVDYASNPKFEESKDWLKLIDAHIEAGRRLSNLKTEILKTADDRAKESKVKAKEQLRKNLQKIRGYRAY